MKATPPTTANASMIAVFSNSEVSITLLVSGVGEGSMYPSLEVYVPAPDVVSSLLSATGVDVIVER